MEFSVTDLTCRREAFTIVERVRFALGAGQALILRGRNGSGKTTLLRCLAGLDQPLGGQMSFSAEDVAYAGHADGIKSQLSVVENLRFWAQVYGAAGIEPALSAFDLHGLRDRRAQDLSAGQKRRVSLARLVLTGRPFWALDEPTVSLDSQAVGWFGDAIRQHLSAGGAAIIATHIDLGLPDAAILDLEPFRARPQSAQIDPFLTEELQ